MIKHYQTYNDFVKSGGEKKWQKYWQENKINYCDLTNKTKPKFYNLVMFFYPSGAKIHIGHAYNYTGADVYGRYKRLKGLNVFEPMGYDAFGLPAENYAIKTGIHPAISTRENIEYGKKQLQELGLMYDWEKEIDTSSPEYYQWTQWLFGILYQAGLAYQAEAPVNWCPSCKTVLANEQVISGKCERCDSQVVQKNLKQWFFKITAYADKLLEGHKKINWPEETIAMQRNWIGKSEGVTISFPFVILNEAKRNEESLKQKRTKGSFATAQDDNKLSVFTTRPDTLFGVTFMVVAPEHELIRNQKLEIRNWEELKEYINNTKKKTDLERTDLAKEKTGVELKGIKAVNPVNGKEIPIFVADYVLPHYGTGAIMAVPAHDERDWEFAKKYGLEIVPVVKAKQRGLAIIIHGFEGMAKSNWFPWAKEELESLGFEVILLDMPNSYHPKLEEWLETLEPYVEKVNENSLVIGHSLGGPVAAHFVANLPHKIKGLYLVAPASSKLDFESLRKEYPQSDIDSLEKICKTPIDWQKAKRNSEYIFGLISDNDDAIPLKKTEKIFKTHHINYQILNNKGHIQEPPLYELIDSFVRLGFKTQPNESGCYEGEGIAINSGGFDGLATAEFKEKIINWLEEKGLGKREVNYRLRDWLISRQRYWGAPIPMIECQKCGWVLVPEKDLPVKLPELEDFKATSEGESPLAKVKEFINTKCPQCGGPAKRSTETMDTFVCSSWYYLRFLNPHLKDKPFDKKVVDKWLPVDQYCGGAEHACLHLLYARFITKVLYDQGYINFDEPFTKLNHQGMILAEDGGKMSKSKGNVVVPDDYIKKYGADVFRLYILFLAPFEEGGAWNDQGIIGVQRFLNKVWKLSTRINMRMSANDYADISKQISKDPQKNSRIIHQTIKKVTEDIENFHFNTAISQLMILVNELEKLEKLLVINFEKFILLLSPFAPHIAEELWHKLDEEKRAVKTVFDELWPEYDQALAQEQEIELVIQVNGKVRDKVRVPADISESNVTKVAMKSEKIQKWLADKEPKKVIFVPGKLVNIVI